MTSSSPPCLDFDEDTYFANTTPLDYFANHYARQSQSQSNNSSSSTNNSSVNNELMDNNQSINNQLLKYCSGHEIGNEALCWELSSAKPYQGIKQLRDNNFNTFWQSDGNVPHSIEIKFHKKQAINQIAIYCDYGIDESYTPLKICIKCCPTQQLKYETITTQLLEEPIGWQIFHLNNVKTNKLLFQILSSHQNGRDTHIRQFKLFSAYNQNHLTLMRNMCTMPTATASVANKNNNDDNDHDNNSGNNYNSYASSVAMPNIDRNGNPNSNSNSNSTSSDNNKENQIQASMLADYYGEQMQMLHQSSFFTNDMTQFSCLR